jgi:hypothetical protein
VSSLLRRSGAPALLAALALLVLAPGAPAHDAGSITKSAGAVEATVSWDGAEFGVANPRLRIVRAGLTAFDASIADVCPRYCVLVADSPQLPDDSILHVADLDGDGEPEVVLDTYSGGAHCCITARIYEYRAATGTYARAPSVPFGNLGYRLQDLDGDGRPEFNGTDDAFAYAFSSFASSAFPPLILRFTRDAATGRTRMRDVTRSFPAVIRKAAASLRKDIRGAKRSHDGTYEAQGAIAAYVADQYLLGRGSVGRAELRRARRRGLTAKGFERQLLRFLHRQGYR